MNQDIDLVHGTLERTAANIDKSRTYNQNTTVNVNVEKLDAKDKQDVNALARAIASKSRRTAMGYGMGSR